MQEKKVRLKMVVLISSHTFRVGGGRHTWSYLNVLIVKTMDLVVKMRLRPGNIT
jgi:hypothetical protein